MACIIEIRDRELYVFIGKKNKKTIKVSSAFRIYLQESLFTNHEVTYSENLVEQVKDILKKNKVNIKNVDVVINHRVALTKDIFLPKTDRKKLNFIVENEMTTMFNLTKDFIVDYRILENVQEEGLNKVRVIASAMRKTTIRGLEQFFNELGMRIKSIDTAPSSFLKIIETLNLINTLDPVTIIDASSSYIRYYLYNRKEFVLMRTLYIQLDNDPIEVSNRALHVLEILSQSQMDVTGKSLKKVRMVGFDKRFGMIAQVVEKNLNIVPEPLDINDYIKPNSFDNYDFLNSMGVLL